MADHRANPNAPSREDHRAIPAVPPSDLRICITGATGFLGAALAVHLARWPHERVLICGRSKGKTSLRDRVAEILAGEGLEAPQGWRFCQLDLVGQRIDGEALRSFQPDVVVHAAADTSIMGGWQCDLVNRKGTELLLRSIEGASSPRFVFVSTAYVHGAGSGELIREADGRAAVDAIHLSAYARSKADAERLVEASGLPSLILRPSILVGPNGHAGRNWVRELSQWAAVLGEAPVDPDAAVDIVPVDFCVNAILSSLGERQDGVDVCNISAGAESLRCSDLVRLGQAIRSRRDPLRLIPPEQWDQDRFERTASTDERYALARISPLLPHLNLNVSFCNRRLRDEVGVVPPSRHDMEAAITRAVTNDGT